MKDPEYSHRPLSGVLETMVGSRRKVYSRSRAHHPLLPAEMEDSFSIDDVDDLVVNMAVVRCATRRDQPEELRDVAAANILVDEVAELPVGTRPERRLVGVADCPADRSVRRVVCLRRLDDHDYQVVGARGLELVLLARPHVRAGVRLERMRLVAHPKGAAS